MLFVPLVSVLVVDLGGRCHDYARNLFILLCMHVTKAEESDSAFGPYGFQW